MAPVWLDIDKTPHSREPRADTRRTIVEAGIRCVLRKGYDQAGPAQAGARADRGRRGGCRLGAAGDGGHHPRGPANRRTGAAGQLATAAQDREGPAAGDVSTGEVHLPPPGLDGADPGRRAGDAPRAPGLPSSTARSACAIGTSSSGATTATRPRSWRDSSRAMSWSCTPAMTWPKGSRSSRWICPSSRIPSVNGTCESDQARQGPDGSHLGHAAYFTGAALVP